MTTPIYRLFERQWKRGDAHCSVADLEEAVQKELITQDESERIQQVPRDV